MKPILKKSLKIVAILILQLVLGCEKDEIPPKPEINNCEKVVQGDFILVE